MTITPGIGFSDDVQGELLLLLPGKHCIEEIQVFHERRSYKLDCECFVYSQ